jgi:hypothetical protein
MKSPLRVVGGASRANLGVSQVIFPCPVKTWGSIEND